MPLPNPPRLTSAEDATTIRTYFRESGYEAEDTRNRLILFELPSPKDQNVPRLLEQTKEETALNLLVRWFFVGSAVDISAARKVIPSAVLDSFERTALLVRDGDRYTATAMFTPFGPYLIASDHSYRVNAEQPGDAVLWPNPTTRHLRWFRMPVEGASVLDLGCGCGALALDAASSARSVTATDLNPRAAEFTSFNARLNGFENIEAIHGDGFEPVSGRRFDLILCNPPFFISPASEHMYCETPFELDGFCRFLVKQSHEYLEEGGFLQILFEGAQIEGQPWTERIKEWIEDSGADAWIARVYSKDPLRYAQQRIYETATEGASHAELFARWVAHYKAKQVEAIHGGLLALRKRDAATHWMRFDDLDDVPSHPFGGAVRQIFEAQDLLESDPTGDRLLAFKPKLASGTSLRQEFRCDGSRWALQSMVLRITDQIPRELPVPQHIAQFLSGFDGSRSLEELIEELSVKVKAPVERVREECKGLTRSLVERGFVVLE